MASPKLLRGRMSQPGAFYSITTIAHGRRPLFRDPVLAELLVTEVEAAARSGCIEPVAWVVMPDHLHYVLQLHAGSLSGSVQALKSRSAMAVNAARSSRGAVWQAGFYDHRLRDEEDLLKQARYVIENPLRRGLVARIEEYPFWWCQWVERGTAL